MIQTAGSRHLDLVDKSGTAFSPPQGERHTPESLKQLFSQFAEADKMRRLRQEAELRDKQAREMRERLANEKRMREANRGGSDDEDEFSEGGGRKAKEIKIKINIEYVTPYRPTADEVEEFYDV